MSRRSQLSAADRRRHDRSALLQWVAIAVVIGLGLVAALVLIDGDGGGTHLNAPVIGGPSA